MIARSLSDLGVRMIETGHPSVSPDVLEGIRQIVRMKDQGMISSELIAHSRSMASDIDLAVSTGVDRVAISMESVEHIFLQNPQDTGRGPSDNRRGSGKG
ncbi:MAG: hypothetical protein AMDU5_GPLC00017G0064 [Thermoplasmatales archaeon Gpl]|nr:MAG: hypothetical protein AMDU5_GPLC00017G0064 [Thermoplasmatales archaeon Gpl]